MNQIPTKWRLHNSYFVMIKRYKSRDHWATLQKHKFPKDRALESFDDFYGTVFGLRWKNMRIAMLCERKYVALLNIFGDIEQTKAKMEGEGAANLKQIFESVQTNMVDRENVTSLDKSPVNVDKFLEKTLKEEELTLNSDDKLEVDDTKKPVDFATSLNQTLKENTAYELQRMVNKNDMGPLYDFIPATKIKGMEDYVFESDHYRYYSNQTDFPLNVVKEKSLEYPENLNIYTYESGNTSTYYAPKRGTTGVFSHYLLDGASVLPVLALGIKPGDRVLDACSAPGGKSLIMLQTLYPNILVCNDLSESRLNRLKYVMNDFVYDFKTKWLNDRIFISQSNAINMTDYGTFDKILVDVPCTSDRYSVNFNENNYFKPTRIKERLKLPETQAAILANCIEMLKPGGSLVYSTCSLSPVQNDGVVHMALSRLFKEKKISVTVHDLSVMTKLFDLIYKFENPNKLRFGQLVLPHLPSNFGPMYFSKITRN